MSAAAQRLAERRALVTGAASGIGLACVEALLAEGCDVAAFDVEAPPLEDARVRTVQGDVSAAEDVAALWRALAAAPPDVLVSCAGIGVHERLDEGDPERWARVVAVNLVGALRVVRAFAPAMMAAGGGDIVLVGSVAGRKAYAWGGAYGASKAGLAQAAEALRLELLPHVRVTLVAPGMVRTDFFEHALGHVPSPADVGEGALEPADVAEVVTFALSRPPGVAVHSVTVRPRAQRF